MTENTFTRRSFLQAGAATSGTVVLGSIAGCSDSSDGTTTNGTGNGNGGNGNGDDRTTSETGNGDDSGNGTGDTTGSGTGDVASIVPQRAEMIVTMDFAGMADDQSIRSVANAFIDQIAEMQGESYQGPTSVDEAFSTAEGASGLDPNSVSSMTLFAELSTSMQSEQYGGAVMSTSLSASDITAAMDESDTQYQQTTYSGKTVYTFDPSQAGETIGSGVVETGAMGVLGNGQFAFGTQTVVEDIIDVMAGDASSISGDLANYYGQTRSGYMRFASMIPEGTFEGDSSSSVPGMSNVQYVTGSFYSGGSTLGIESTLHAADSDSASQLSGILQMAVSQMESDQSSEEVKNLIDALTISQDGTAVTINFEDSVDDLEMYARLFARSFVGRTRSTPQAAFDFDYDGDAGTLTITHVGGDMIPARNLVVRGTDLGGGNTGRWSELPGATTSSEINGEAAVSAGDSVTLGDTAEQAAVSSSFVVNIVYQEGDMSAVLSRNIGPDA